MSSNDPIQWHGTTILCVRKGSEVVIAGDGQVSMGQTVMKSNARKVRRLAGGDVMAGFAGATADAFTLFERLESARALADIEGMDAETIARKAMKIAADICVYTNHNVIVEKM